MIEEPEVGGHLRVGQRPAERALAEGRDERLGLARRIGRRVRGNEARQGRGVARDLAGEHLGGVEQLCAQLFGDEQAFCLVVEPDQGVPRHGALDVGDVGQLE